MKPTQIEPIKTGRVKVDDVHLYYEVYGQGEPLVLVAGTGASCANWRIFQVPEFSQHGQVVIYDHRGLSRSDKPDMKYTARLCANAEVVTMKGAARGYLRQSPQKAHPHILDFPRRH